MKINISFHVNNFFFSWKEFVGDTFEGTDKKDKRRVLQLEKHHIYGILQV